MENEAERLSYPVVLNLCDRLVVVVGAGAVGQRKVSKLLQAGAKVRLVDPALDQADWSAAAVEAIARPFCPEDLTDAALVFACTDSAQVNQQVATETRRRNLLCCRADLSDGGDFSLPAVWQQGRLSVAVSTAGGSPALAAEIRDRVADSIPASWALSLEVMAEIRQKLLTGQFAAQYNHQVLRSFWVEQLLPLLELGKLCEIDQLLIENFGPEFSLEQLHLQLPEGSV
ncbi:bifunctional precorrin-2 dehydrogenase/sirohydrochlorin ferrochelatase [Malonomonas rubra]|uniref:precorrin-2 dehydrogenase/sirohydrochlorin ferrochelatase family protein n=1 Tax=Malonomonas rubra TaxID=57040 RepID=UPI0026EAF11E|nr:bifunctional precorrin-2 dehydrogenase/sirohydrochlorin ferrochelatase [Malonomonas rubra]